MSEKAWAIKHPRMGIYLWTIGARRTDAIREIEKNYMKSWAELKRLSGYKAVKVLIEEAVNGTETH